MTKTRIAQSSDQKEAWAAQGDGTETPGEQPQEGPYWSLMFEVSESELKPVNNATESFAGGSWAGVVRECVEGALATKLISAENQIVSLYHRCLSQSLTLKHTLQPLACPIFIYQAKEHGRFIKQESMAMSAGNI